MGLMEAITRKAGIAQMFYSVFNVLEAASAQVMGDYPRAINAGGYALYNLIVGGVSGISYRAGAWINGIATVVYASGGAAVLLGTENISPRSASEAGQPFVSGIATIAHVGEENYNRGRAIRAIHQIIGSKKLLDGELLTTNLQSSNCETDLDEKMKKWIS